MAKNVFEKSNNTTIKLNQLVLKLMKLWKSYKSKIQTEKLHAISDEAKIKGTPLLHLFWPSP